MKNAHGVLLCEAMCTVLYSSCWGKYRYVTVTDAAAVQHTDGGRQPTYIYPCQICDGYHVTTTDDPTRFADPSWTSQVERLAAAVKADGCYRHPSLDEARNPATAGPETGRG